MRITQALRLFQRNVLLVQTASRHVTLRIANQPIRTVHNTRWALLKNGGVVDGSDPEDNLTLSSNANYLDLDLSQARDLVYEDRNDHLLDRIYDCVSVQELFNVYQKNANQYNCDHLMQSVLVLYDLKSIFVEINGGEDHLKRLTLEFAERLNDSETFQKMLQNIRDNVGRFSVESLSFVVLYLNKLGMSIGDLQALTKVLEAKLLKKFSIAAAAKFLEAVFSDYSLSSYFLCQSIVPEVIKHIDTCCSLKDLEDLTVALNKLHIFIRDEDLEAYKEMIEDCIDSGRIRGSDYSLILKTLSLLNYPKWREKNTFLMSKCILLTKNCMSTMNVNQLLVLYEVFYKIQGPASVLNALQRCSSRFLLQLEDTTVISKRLDLLSSVIYFSPPDMRNKLRNDIEKYLNGCNSLETLQKLRTIMSSLKLSDQNLCKNYWDKVLRILKSSDLKEVDLVRLSMHYVTFDTDLHYRHEEFEVYLLKLLKVACFEPEYMFYPAKLSALVSFALLYCSNDPKFLEYLTGKLEENWSQLNRIDCLKMSSALRTFNAMSGRELKQSFAVRLSKLQDRIIEKEVYSDMDLWKNNALVKCCVFKGNVKSSLTNRLLMNYRRFTEFSTKDIENISFSFLSTNTFIPEVMEGLVDYAVKFKDHLHGFSLERILYLCYSVGYIPSNEEFYSHASNIIIRDQGRMTGLSLIHSALAMCFFHRLPDSLIKAIFSVDFMEKLEMELDNCYSKDRYPMRVRQNLMFLNRGVCLDYPESNVRWFHEKSMKEINESVAGKHQKVFPTRVRECLLEVVGDRKLLEENFVSPYGYPIDFVINLDKRGKLVPNSSQVDSRLAILLVPQYAYTEIYPQLRGKYQMQQRHLEILGYKVVMLNYTDWISLTFAAERISFLRALIWPKKPRHLNNINSGFS